MSGGLRRRRRRGKGELVWVRREGGSGVHGMEGTCNLCSVCLSLFSLRRPSPRILLLLVLLCILCLGQKGDQGEKGAAAASPEQVFSPYPGVFCASSLSLVVRSRGTGLSGGGDAGQQTRSGSLGDGRLCAGPWIPVSLKSPEPFPLFSLPIRRSSPSHKDSHQNHQDTHHARQSLPRE